jgi:plasmid stabilization system protein ParE
MLYEVVLQRLAVKDLDLAYSWAAKNAPATALAWFERFQSAIRSLAHNPKRCIVAQESRRAGVEIRELHFGRRPNVFRVLFLIDGQIVRVLRIRRAQRRRLTKREIDDAQDLGN